MPEIGTIQTIKPSLQPKTSEIGPIGQGAEKPIDRRFYEPKQRVLEPKEAKPIETEQVKPEIIPEVSIETGKLLQDLRDKTKL